MTDFDIKTTCAFTGHRILKSDFSFLNLERIIDRVIESGYRTFLVGMAIGFDTAVFEILERKRNKNIDIIACVPCKEQDKYFTKKQREKYKELIDKADKVVYVSNEYFDGCMQKRNVYMVDNSSLLVAYVYSNRGGSIQTRNYALKKDKIIIDV